VLNDCDPRIHDLWKIDLVTAGKVLAFERTEFRTVHFDASYQPRVAEKLGRDRSLDLPGFELAVGSGRQSRLLKRRVVRAKAARAGP
jgi:hypothetical protein